SLAWGINKELIRLSRKLAVSYIHIFLIFQLELAQRRLSKPEALLRLALANPYTLSSLNQSIQHGAIPSLQILPHLHPHDFKSFGKQTEMIIRCSFHKVYNLKLSSQKTPSLC